MAVVQLQCGAELVMAKIAYVDPNKVTLPNEVPPLRDIRYQMGLLDRQGQIVPLVGKESPDGTWSIDDSDYPYAVAQVVAARALEWPTIIVTDSSYSD